MNTTFMIRRLKKRFRKLRNTIMRKNDTRLCVDKGQIRMNLKIREVKNG